jgi:hypothetical protein
MPEQKFILSHTPTTDYRVLVSDNPSSATLTLEITFEFSAAEERDLAAFLKAVKADPGVQRSYWHDGNMYQFEYDPHNADLAKFVITRCTTKRAIPMALSTAFKLLDALTGQTERLVKEDEPSLKTEQELYQELHMLASANGYRVQREDGLIDIIPEAATPGGATTLQHSIHGLKAAIKWLNDRIAQ